MSAGTHAHTATAAMQYCPVWRFLCDLPAMYTRYYLSQGSLSPRSLRNRYLGRMSVHARPTANTTADADSDTDSVHRHCAVHPRFPLVTDGVSVRPG
jgi:hypothetical protein